MLCSQEPEVLRGEFCPSFVNLEILKELRLQQEIEDAHDNKVAYNTRPVWGPKNLAVSFNLIKEHFCQIWGLDGAPFAYFMRKHVVPPLVGKVIC